MNSMTPEDAAEILRSIANDIQILAPDDREKQCRQDADSCRQSATLIEAQAAEIEWLRNQLEAISELFPADATHRHECTGESLLDNVRDALAENARLRDALAQAKAVGAAEWHEQQARIEAAFDGHESLPARKHRKIAAELRGKA